MDNFRRLICDNSKPMFRLNVGVLSLIADKFPKLDQFQDAVVESFTLIVHVMRSTIQNVNGGAGKELKPLFFKVLRIGLALKGCLTRNHNDIMAYLNALKIMNVFWQHEYSFVNKKKEYDRRIQCIRQLPNHIDFKSIAIYHVDLKLQLEELVKERFYFTDKETSNNCFDC